MIDHTPSTSNAPQPGATAEPPVLEVRGLHRYFGDLRAVQDLSFTAAAGHVMGFIGPNGAGKTTTMRIIATLDTPTAGDVFVCGHSVMDDPDRVRQQLGFMPDSFGKYPNMDVLEYLDFFARSYGLRGESRHNSVSQVMQFTELDSLASKPVTSLSKGMSQRLGLARTLIHDPQILILDEPAAGLDPRARIELRELLRLLASEMNKTVLISSHILTELGEICDSTAIIEAGQMVACGTVDAIRNAYQRRAKHVEGTQLRIRTLDRMEELDHWLLEQPFVSHVSRDQYAFTCVFNEQESAQYDLLKRMIDAGFPIVEFHGQQASLEDAFMALTEGTTQ
jgi:ABC-2 type transport system ATP-binding protein